MSGHERRVEIPGGIHLGSITSRQSLDGEAALRVSYFPERVRQYGKDGKFSVTVPADVTLSISSGHVSLPPAVWRLAIEALTSVLDEHDEKEHPKMSATKTLHDEMRRVVANIEAREWIQGAERRGDAVCAHGAVMTCQGLRPGDEWILRAVMRAKGVTEEWNDNDGRTKSEVVARMSLIGCTDEDLAETFGPSWRLVVSVIRRSALLTADEASRLRAVRAAARAAVGDAARAAVGAAARAAVGAAARAAVGAAVGAAARAAVGDAARAAARAAVGAAVGDAARAAVGAVVDWTAVGDAARAAVGAHLVGQHGLTQQHIDTLMRPWIEALGADWAAVTE